MRTHSGNLSLAQKAIKKKKTVKGITGFSPLAECVNLVDGVPVDYMHAILESIMCQLMKLWFESKNHRKPYYPKRTLMTLTNC